MRTIAIKRVMKILLKIVVFIIVLFLCFIVAVNVLAYSGVLLPGSLLPYIVTTEYIMDADAAVIEGTIVVHGGTLRSTDILVIMENEKIRWNFHPDRVTAKEFYFFKVVRVPRSEEVRSTSPLHRVVIIPVPKEVFDRERFPYTVYCLASGYKCYPQKIVVTGPSYLEFQLIKVSP